MNISYNWLKDLIDIYLPPDELATQLTRVGLAVEGIHAHGNDFVLDIDLTSNRPDCLSHLGVAREIAAVTGAAVKTRVELDGIPLPPVLAGEIVTIEDPEFCHRFTARSIRNVRIGPSPEWLVARLEAIGERSINNVADITNYVMHELGQPMHAFDLDKLAENRIVVRTSTRGEAIKTLDEVDRKLDKSMLAICDAEKPVAVAGVMGGYDSGITETTSNVLLEVAYFKRGSVRATARKLGLTTEASYRFERGVDIDNLKRASDRATQLICDLASGMASDFIDIYPTLHLANEVESKDISSAVKRLTGLDVETSECLSILAALGISTPDQLTIFIAPPWRHDIAIEEDLVEEIARHVGYENIKDELPPAFGAGEYQKHEARKKRLRNSLVDVGFDEAIGYSFIDTKHDGVFTAVPELTNDDITERFVTLRDSVIEGAVRMRTSLIPGLLDSVRLNLNHRRRDLKLFEIGKVFAADGDGELPREREVFAAVLTGGEMHEGRAVPARELDFYDAKGTVEATLSAAGASLARFDAEDVLHLRKGQSAVVTVGEERIGYIGRLNEEIAANYKFRQAVYIAEIDLQRVLDHAIEPVRYTSLPRYPPIVRDVSFAVTRDVTFDAIRNVIVGRNINLCRNVGFVDLFEGKGLGENERSLTVRIEYQSDARTLTEDEIEPIHRELVGFVESELKIHQRI